VSDARTAMNAWLAMKWSSARCEAFFGGCVKQLIAMLRCSASTLIGLSCARTSVARWLSNFFPPPM
jgi:hypothetical protein